MQEDVWEFWIDVGGTFTDCFARLPDGTLRRHKLLSSGVTKGAVRERSGRSVLVDPSRRVDPAGFWNGFGVRLLSTEGETLAEATVDSFDATRGEFVFRQPLRADPLLGQAYELHGDTEAPILAIRYLLGLPAEAAIPPVRVRLGTTRGTNALITRRGAKTAFVTTRGFGDVLHIGCQNRPKLFELAIKKPLPLFTTVVEVDERVTAEGEVLRAPDEVQVRMQLLELRSKGIESLAICLLHGFKHPKHERLVERVAREVGFCEISLSHRVAPLMKIVSRGDTTVVDGYLNPVLRGYVERLRHSLSSAHALVSGAPASRAGELRIMTSAGGLVAADQFVGKDSILSGPAGGVVGFARVAQQAGFERAIGFDMGGTSTDVARFDGRFELEYETEKAGVRVVAPMLAIETVAAGGGSICSFDGAKLVVGPDSAGADPGPACYGRGGPLAVTDLNFYLGKIPPQHFPFPLDRTAVEHRLQRLMETIAAATGRSFSPVELCDGFLRVANSNMVKAIQSISVAKGYDPRDYVLVAFGGAAGQHACAVASDLQMRQVLLHADAGLLSAYGIGQADVSRHRAVGVYQPYSNDAVAALSDRFQQMAAEARREVLNEGIGPQRIEIRRSLDLRYRGLDAYLTIPEPADGDYAEAYAAEHERLYGYRRTARPLEIVAARVEVLGHSGQPPQPSQPCPPRRPRPESYASVWFDAVERRTGVYARAELEPGDAIEGPAVIHESASTTLIDPGWHGEILSGGELLLGRVGQASWRAPAHQSAASGQENAHGPSEADPVLLEIFNNQFAGIAEQMGITLRNTASSVNVKERLDFSCAIFTATGDLVVNAPHIPVHLGAMSETVKRLLEDFPDMSPGDVLVTNNPYRGGSHLPDVTVVTPVFASAADEREQRALVFFTASRAHHAEIGGIRPGSLPPFSRNLAEEGVLIRGMKLVDRGQSRLDEFKRLLLSGKYPTRNVADNVADVEAQLAANHRGARDLGQLVERYRLEVVLAYMRHIQAAAERKMRLALARLGNGEHRFVDHLDDGSPIAVTVTIRGEKATIDFTGTGPVLAGNLNANRAIVTAAVMYCLRALIGEEIPLNQGVLAPVQIVLSECLLNPPEGRTPEECPAVVGGNVETSQRVVDVLLGALRLAAASQGTMNNLVFGGATFGYYETICGGAGATAESDGADAVHTHMTNTRLTDPEVIEHRYPVRVREFAIRRGSGGAGQHRGGDGVIRKLEFLETLDVSMVSQRRGDYPPYGLMGGEPGAIGRNSLVHADGTTEELGGFVQFTAGTGDVLTIETPGGGGYRMAGSAAPENDEKAVFSPGATHP
ncbi:MAG TPA: hydantoinase B/oxoprolinase family protein [Pirellulales bacterium]|nr:hydantoinase B/oxoprolinase family protein [Pirellulales bacterium]